jgi:D-alanyl-D-alanine carboxypeptidase
MGSNASAGPIGGARGVHWAGAVPEASLEAEAATSARAPALRSATRRRAGRRLLNAALAVALAAAAYAGQARAEDEAEDAAKRAALLVVDANSGRVLQQSAADAPRHPASLTKLMTLYLVFERMRQGRLGVQTKIRMSAEAAAASPSKLELEEGAEIALSDAIKVLITKSANDVAIAIAEHIAGSEAKFARLMTRKAHQLGMAATTFRNASGLPDDEQVTTARDMVTLALHLADDFPEHYALFATRAFTYNGETFHNHNSLLLHFPGTDGLKTGYTRASGFNLVASVHRGRKHVVGVIFGGASAEARDRAMQVYLTRALALAADVRTRAPQPQRVAARTPRPAQALAVPAPQRAARPRAAPAAAGLAPSADGVERAAEQHAERAGDTSSTAAGAAAPSAPPEMRAATSAIAMPRVRQVLVGERLTAAAPTRPSDEQPADIAALLAEPRTDAAHPTVARLGAPPVGSPPSSGPPPPAGAPNAREGDGDRPLLRVGVAPQGAARAAGQTPPPPAAVPEPASARAVHATPVHGFVIQIGAYRSVAEAERQLALAKSQVPALREAHPPVTEEVKSGTRLLFRARYGGFAAAAGAADVCEALKRQGFACLVLKAP